jgi:hypothetical protein
MADRSEDDWSEKPTRQITDSSKPSPGRARTNDTESDQAGEHPDRSRSLKIFQLGIVDPILPIDNVISS